MDISIQTLIFVMANFLILVAILYKFMWGPVIRMIDSRQQTIDDSLNKADEARREAEQMSAKLAEEIADARRQAKAILDEAQKNAEVTKEDILAQARNSADSILGQRLKLPRKKPMLFWLSKARLRIWWYPWLAVCWLRI